MEDKEAVEKMKTILQQQFNAVCTNTDGVWAGYSLDHHTTDDFVRQISDVLDELGYRKPPKEKPPLLSDDELRGVVKGEEREIGEKWHNRGILIMCEQHAIAQAQRESDIKYYEG